MSGKTAKIPVFSWDLLGKILTIAIPSILQQSFISVGNILVQGCINGFGVSVAAGYSAAVKLNNLVITSFTTIGNGISNFSAQNIGAKTYPRVKDGFRAGVKLVWTLSVPLCLLYLLLGKYLLLLFMDESSIKALQTGQQFLRILSPFYFLISVKLTADGVLRGAGAMKQFMAATFTDLILRVALAFALSAAMQSETGIWLSWPIGWCLGTVLSIIFYRNGYWNTVRSSQNSL